MSHSSSILERAAVYMWWISKPAFQEVCTTKNFAEIALICIHRWNRIKYPREARSPKACATPMTSTAFPFSILVITIGLTLYWRLLFGGIEVPSKFRLGFIIPGRDNEAHGMIILYGDNEWDNESTKSNISRPDDFNQLIIPASGTKGVQQQFKC